MNDLSRTHNEFRTTIMSLHPHSSDTSKLRFISPDVPFFSIQEMEKPYDQVTCCSFCPHLCWQRLGSWLDVYHQEHCLRQICPSHSFFPTIQTQIPPNEVPWFGIQKKLHGLDRHKWGKLFFNPENQVKKGWLHTGKRVNYYKAEKLS
jgi:hypothetical protein